MKTLVFSLVGSMGLAMGFAAAIGLSVIPQQQKQKRQYIQQQVQSQTTSLYYSVTFPQIGGNLDIYSGFHKLPFYGVRNRWGKPFAGHNAAQISLWADPLDPSGEQSMDITIPDFPPSASTPRVAEYKGAGNVLRLVSAPYGGNWPGSISVQWNP